jgi:hypothetical protein
VIVVPEVLQALARDLVDRGAAGAEAAGLLIEVFSAPPSALSEVAKIARRFWEKKATTAIAAMAMSATTTMYSVLPWPASSLSRWFIRAIMGWAPSRRGSVASGPRTLIIGRWARELCRNFASKIGPLRDRRSWRDPPSARNSPARRCRRSEDLLGPLTATGERARPAWRPPQDPERALLSGTYRWISRFARQVVL